MSKLITGKEALIALANGKEVLYIANGYEDKPNGSWGNAKEVEVEDFLNNAWSFKLKPQTITINDIEVPKPRSIGWGNSNRNKVEIEFDSEDEAHEFYMKFKEFW